ncbi:acyl-CoA dehydrogenase family protein [Saccharopolyspora gregorii]|uniref:acyl-CoA dehydrogenase family protein n=1 Tax=Saccharopolyspora gregorii TaxID=33914 RepID=UPI0021AD38A6|nr:acyl-CoA dehydrogenase family protein [Saccharopolyspora gregorii]
MRFTRTTAQQDMAESLRALLADVGGTALARAWSDGDAAPWWRCWARLGELGACGVAVPGEFGGLGLGAVETAVCLEEFGYAGLPGPVVETVAVAPALLAGSADQHRLPELAAGRAVLAVAFDELVPRALDADVAAATYRCAGTRVLRADPVGAPERSVDPVRRLWALGAAGTAVAGARPAAAFDAGVLGCAAQLLGAGRRLLDDSVRHVRDRHQFGRPVGSFQAVKHHLADVALRLEFARPLLHGACLSLDAGAAHAARDASAAKLAAAEAAHLAARTALQVHGAIGYTAEHPLHLWTLKVTALRAAWGDPAWHRRRIADALAAGSTADIGTCS